MTLESKDNKTSPTDAWIGSKMDEWMQQSDNMPHSQQEAWLRTALAEAIEKGREDAERQLSKISGGYEAGASAMKEAILKALPEGMKVHYGQLAKGHNALLKKVVHIITSSEI